MKDKVLIVGHGLAGAMLAQVFIQHGVRVDVSEANLPYCASSVAAGLVNPLIGPKLNPPVDIDHCLDEIMSLSKRFHLKCGDKFYEELTLHRVFRNQKQADIWNSSEGRLSKFQIKGVPLLSHDLRVEAPYGLVQTKCLRLNVTKFLEFSKQSLIESGNWNQQKFDHREKTLSKVIFCEGFRVSSNPWFSHLPFAPVRGETLRIKQFLPNATSNGTWAIPENRESFLAGSTWDHKKLESGPTKKGKESILSDLNYLNLNQLFVEEQMSGVRSGTLDRNPIIGKHPKNPNLFIFNGFGSRGATTIPLYAKMLLEFILEGKPIPSHLDVRRFS